MTITPRSPSEFGVFRCIAAAEALLTSSVPTRFTSISLRKKSPGIAPSLPSRRGCVPMPAQLTAISRPPSSATAAASAASTADSEATSTRSKLAAGPSSATAAATAAALRSSSATRPPLAIRARAVASPSPEPPPVTAARVPRMSMTSEPKAAVDVEATSGKEIVLRDKQRGVRDFLGKAQALERDGGRDLLQRLRRHAGQDVGPRKAGRDATRADAIPCELLGPHHRHRCDTGLRGGVVRLPVVASARDAGDVDDQPAVAELDHALGALAGAEKNAREVDVDHGLPLCEAHLADDRAVLDLDEQGVFGDARVVDQDVEAAEGRDDRIERPDDLLLARNVDDGGRDPRAAGLELGPCRLEVRRIQVEKCDVCSARDESRGDGFTYAAAAARDGDHLVLQLHMGGQRVISMAIEAASPPPMHCEAMPRFKPRCRSAWRSVVIRRAPVAPIG